MICQETRCSAELSWFRDRILKRPGYYLESEWYCGETCLERGIASRLERRTPARTAAAFNPYKRRLEHVLVANGALTREQLNSAMQTRDANGADSLPQRLLALGLVREHDITVALSQMFNIPVVNLKNRRMSSVVLNVIPVEIARNHRFFPLEFERDKKRLALVTDDPAGMPVMVSLRGILDCEITAYLSDASVVSQMVERYCELSSAITTDEPAGLFNVSDNPQDVARWIVGRAKKIEARSLQVCRLERFIWTRFNAGQNPVNCIVAAARAG